MCGIFGAISTSATFDQRDAEQFRKLTDLVTYRGPDDCGYMTMDVKSSSSSESGRFDVFLASRRLAIIDLSSMGRMPMGDGKGRWVVFNGEIFNYLELRQELQQKYGYRFRTSTDTEVLLAVYDIFGESGFEKLNGMWAFAIVDVPRRRVILSRDRFSIKPLYLLHERGNVYFASEIKQLLPLLSSVKLNEEIMMAFLAQALLNFTQETFFHGIKRVPPRTNVIISLDNGRMDEKVYWSFRPPESEQRPLEDVLGEFHDVLRDCVRIRLRSDVKVGVLLSGGLDSSTVAVLANQFAILETYSVVAADPRYDERRFIDMVAETGLKNTKVIFEPEQAYKDLDDVLYHCDEPVGGFSALAQYRIFATIKKTSNATVLLSGQGGDEILLGYLKFFFFYLHSLFRTGNYMEAIRQLAMALLRRTVTRQFTMREARRYSPFLLKRQEPILHRPYSEVPIWECHDIRARQIADIERYSVPALTQYEDRNSSAYSLEVRHPFLDHRLVELVINLPTHFKIKDGWTKYILRKSMNELPQGVRWRRDKQGFLVPEELWLKREFRPLIEQCFRKSRLSELGILDDIQFMQQYRKFREGGPVWSSDIARVLIAEIWSRKFLE